MTSTENLEGPELADLLAPVLEAAKQGLTPSAAARKAKITTGQAFKGLAWMIENDFAYADGNGAHRRYYAR